jgi:hypothetical protein
MGQPSSFSSFPCCKPRRAIQLPSVIICQEVEENKMEGNHLTVTATLRDGETSVQTLSLIDSGATGFTFIDENFARQHNFPLYRLQTPRDLEVVDGRPNLIRPNHPYHQYFLSDTRSPRNPIGVCYQAGSLSACSQNPVVTTT